MNSPHSADPQEGPADKQGRNMALDNTTYQQGIDLFRKLGGIGTKEGRVVSAILNAWEKDHLLAIQYSQALGSLSEIKGICDKGLEFLAENWTKQTR